MDMEQWDVHMFVSKQEILLKYLVSEIGLGRPHLTEAKDVSHCSWEPPPGSSHNNCSATSEPSEAAISLLCLHTSFILHIAAVA